MRKRFRKFGHPPYDFFLWYIEECVNLPTQKSNIILDLVVWMPLDTCAEVNAHRYPKVICGCLLQSILEIFCAGVTQKSLAYAI